MLPYWRCDFMDTHRSGGTRDVHARFSQGAPALSTRVLLFLPRKGQRIANTRGMGLEPSVVSDPNCGRRDPRMIFEAFFPPLGHSISLFFVIVIVVLVIIIVIHHRLHRHLAFNANTAGARARTQRYAHVAAARRPRDGKESRDREKRKVTKNTKKKKQGGGGERRRTLLAHAVQLRSPSLHTTIALRPAASYILASSYRTRFPALEDLLV